MSKLTLYFPETTGFEKAKSILDESEFEYEIGDEQDLEDAGKKILGEKKPTLVVEAFGGILVDHKGCHSIEIALEYLGSSSEYSEEEYSSKELI